MANTLHWLLQAHQDLKRLHAFIQSYNQNAANRAINTLITAAGSLLEFPEKGHPSDLDMNFRELPVQFGAKGYVIRYRIDGEKIIIVRVWHGLENRL